jgi:hypothetical protein
MPATINGTSGFGGNLTGNVTGNADTSTTAVTADKLSTTTGNAPTYACRAWVNFNATRNTTDTGASTNGSNVLIRSSGNVASVLKNAVGDYTITFTTAMPDANYAIVSTSRNNATSSSYIATVEVNTAPTSSAVRIQTTSPTVLGDSETVSVAIFR